jgi:hypothetical protein
MGLGEDGMEIFGTQYFAGKILIMRGLTEGPSVHFLALNR